jgi:hypothetical protein
MRPVTAWLADDGMVFLPVKPTATDIRSGGDAASEACKQHELLMQSSNRK